MVRSPIGVKSRGDGSSETAAWVGHLPFRTVVHRGPGQAPADGSERWAGQHTGYISHDVEVTRAELALGGPWLDVELPPGPEVMLTLDPDPDPAARTPWDTAPWDAAEEG
jgi:hypothetical protein